MIAVVFRTVPLSVLPTRTASSAWVQQDCCVEEGSPACVIACVGKMQSHTEPGLLLDVSCSMQCPSHLQQAQTRDVHITFALTSPESPSKQQMSNARCNAAEQLSVIMSLLQMAIQATHVQSTVALTSADLASRQQIHGASALGQAQGCHCEQ